MTRDITQWKLYINDYGVVMCALCTQTFEEIGRRCTLDDLMNAIGEHAEVCYGKP